MRKASAPALQDLFESGEPPQIFARQVFFEGGFGATYHTNARSELEWVRNGASSGSVEDRRACIRPGARILVLGDSHMRYASAMLGSYLCGFPVEISKPADGIPAPFSHCPAVIDTLFHSKDELGEFGVPNGQWDYIFASYAQHFFSRFFVALKDYEVIMGERISRLASYAEDHSSARVAWVEVPPMAESTHLEQKNHNDRRTYPRLKLAQLAAQRALEPYLEGSGSGALGYVPMFDLVMGLSDWSDPTFHWTGIPELAKEISLRLLDFICASEEKKSGSQMA